MSLVFIASAMVVTGTINTLSTKWADVTAAKGLDGVVQDFNHPFFQALGMFLGEFSCMFAYHIINWYKSRNGTLDEEELKKVNFNPLLLWLPALCDMTATCLMYLGLTYTYASVFQMLRGAVIIFTGVLSVLFLKRKLSSFHWTGMMLILVGLALVGVASILQPQDDANAPHPLSGDAIIIAATLVTAVQMVIEEKLLTGYNIPPLLMVGWEGFWGFIPLSVILVPFYYIPGPAVGNRLENPLDAIVQMGNSGIITLALVGNVVSIAFFNFTGVTITAKLSATTRMVLDSVRTLIIWIFSLIVGWQSFYWLQIIGFLILLAGTLIYNKILKIPGFEYPDFTVLTEESTTKTSLINDNNEDDNLLSSAEQTDA